MRVSWTVVAFVAILAIPAVAVAQDNGEETVRKSEIRRGDWFRVRASAGLTPEIIGFSAVVRAASPIELEGGLGVGSWFVRAGCAMRLNPASRGSTQFEMVPTVGYAKVWDVNLPGLESVPREIPHGLLGIGVVTWFGPHFGLEGRLNLGGAFAMDYRRDDGTIDEGGFFPIVSFAAGLAF